LLHVQKSRKHEGEGKEEAGKETREEIKGVITTDQKSKRKKEKFLEGKGVSSHPGGGEKKNEVKDHGSTELGGDGEKMDLWGGKKKTSVGRSERRNSTSEGIDCAGKKNDLRSPTKKVGRQRNIGGSNPSSKGWVVAISGSWKGENQAPESLRGKNVKK